MAYVHKGKPLYLTADRADVVEEGDPRAAFLLVADGGSLTDAEAQQYKLGGKSAPAPAVEEKGKAAPENKLKAQPDNKTKG